MALYFVDTNVLLYGIDERDKRKQKLAFKLLEQLDYQQTGVVSTQVLLEFAHNLTSKFKLSHNTASLMAAAYLKWRVVESDASLVMLALARSAQNDLSIWDAMVIEAAFRAKADVLYTEDLQHGQHFGALTVVNPFLTPA
ncbi:MAG: PIN domain-containing protein [Rhodoferax sp.]|nr:PIN domain-containing protein [Rhodoferax sp.]